MTIDFSPHAKNQDANVRYAISVLMVEDDYINIFMMQKTFESLFEISYAKSAQEALNVLRDHSFDLVLMDINLGEDAMDGISIMHEMRKDERHKDTRIFAVTGYVMEGDREKYLNLGFDEHFPKPLAKENLIAVLDNIYPPKV